MRTWGAFEVTWLFLSWLLLAFASQCCGTIKKKKSGDQFLGMAPTWLCFIGQYSSFPTCSTWIRLRLLDLWASQEREALVLASDRGTSWGSLIPGIFHESCHGTQRVFMLPGKLVTTSVEFPPSRIGKNSLLF